MKLLLLTVALFILSLALTGLYRHWAIKKDWLEHPNHRSSHFIAVPGGAGIAILVSYVAALILLTAFGLNGQASNWFWLTPLVLGFIGWLDDHHDISSAMRLAIYAVLILSVIYSLDHSFVFQLFAVRVEQSWLLMAGLALLLIWWINLFNFMDGIDGLAGLQTIFVLLAAYRLSPVLSEIEQYLMLIVVGAVTGFLCWNFPKAKVFMGDAGSIFLGTFIGLIALKSDLSVWVWGILSAVFFVDATYTLLVRMLKRQKWYQAHRSHAYQILSRRYGSHGRVVLLLMAINLVWLFPLALYACKEVYYAPLIMLLAWLPLVGFCFLLGAGKRVDS